MLQQSKIANFYYGVGTDQSGRTLNYILDQDNEWWENTHDFIQWVFPSTERSQFNADAPLLKVWDIATFRKAEVVQANVRRAFQRFMAFLNTKAKPAWVTPGNHNYLRITRALTFLKAAYMVEEFDTLREFCDDIVESFPEDVGETTISYWDAASMAPAPFSSGE